VSTAERERQAIERAHKSGSSRVGALDGIRGLAVLDVLLYHAHFQQFQGGFVGVDVFFVLSGFLITQALVARLDRADSLRSWYGSFLYRRVARLQPTLFVVVGLIWLGTHILGPAAYQQHLTYCTVASVGDFMNLRVSNADVCGGMWHVTWSLAAEEQFYFLWPPLLWFALAYGRRRLKQQQVRLLGVAMVALYGLALLWQIRMIRGGSPTNRYLFAPDGRSMVIILGCATGLLLVTARARTSSLLRSLLAELLAGVGVVGLLWTLHHYSSFGTWSPFLGATETGLATAALIFAVVLHPAGIVRRVFLIPGLPALGRMSYSFYLIHECANRIFVLWFREHTWTGEFARWTLTLALGIGVYRLVERPAQAWLNGLRATRTAPVLAR
jgi:peptidoglycan/LPS O-acetylase OafA/YrhL